MRKIIISILMASAIAAPAAAAPRQQSWGDDSHTQRSESRESRQQSREDRQQSREDRQQSREDREQVRQEQVRSSASERTVEGRSDAVARGRADATARADRESLDTIQRTRAAQLERQQLNQQRRETRDTVAERQARREAQLQLRNRVPVVSETPREGTQPPPVATRNHSTHSWSDRWRYDSRYDWQSWRSRHRSLFQLGYYYDPFGWSYRPYDIGWRLWPSYYSSRFWISDPWDYRLPYAPPGYRWIRYFDDAILVDTWTGEVADVIYNFFW